MFHLIIRIIGLLIIFLGINMIYDGRIITKKFFGFGDQNEATKGLKILGFIITVVGGMVLYFNI